MKKTSLKADRVEDLLRDTNGNVAAVARALGVNRSTVKRFIDNRPSLLEVAADLREAMKDHVESALYNAALKGEAWAVCFFLKTQARDRGYVEHQEHRHSGGAHFSWDQLRQDDPPPRETLAETMARLMPKPQESANGEKPLPAVEPDPSELVEEEAADA